MNIVFNLKREPGTALVPLGNGFLIRKKIKTMKQWQGIRSKRGSGKPRYDIDHDDFMDYDWSNPPF